MEKVSTRLLAFMAVFVPYMALVGYTIAVYPGLPDKLEHGFPKAFVFAPALIAAILPITYAVMVFFLGQYLKKHHYLTVAAFMDLGILGLLGAVYLIKVG